MCRARYICWQFANERAVEEYGFVHGPYRSNAIEKESQLDMVYGHVRWRVGVEWIRSAVGERWP
jgi:hypothetical protein